MRTLVWVWMAMGVLIGSAGAEGRKLAVVVGVDQYRANSDLPALKHAGSDAALLSTALRGQGYTVFEMTHASARRPGQEVLTPQLDYIRDQVEGILGFPNLGGEDSIVIALHGHGVQFDAKDDKGSMIPQFYFCPADATVAGIKTADQLTDRCHLLPLEELYKELGNCKAGTKLLIVDACRNDPNRSNIFKSSLASATLPKVAAPSGGTAAFFSCKANQRAIEDTQAVEGKPTLNQGVFTHFLVQGLNGAADQPLANSPRDGVVTFAELSAYVANNTYAHVYNKYGVRQSPELRGDYDLNLPLTRSYQAPPPRVVYTDAQLDEYLLTVFRAQLADGQDRARTLQDPETLLQQFRSLYGFYLDASLFGLNVDSSSHRDSLLEFVSRMERLLKSPPTEEADPVRRAAALGVLSCLEGWLEWDQLSKAQRARLTALRTAENGMRPKSAEEATRQSWNDRRDEHRQASLYSLRRIVSADVFEGLVVRAIRDRYWQLAMNNGLPEDRRPRLHINTVLECDHQTPEAIAALPRGRPLVVQFSGLTWCKPCQNTLPQWRTLKEKFGDQFNFVLVSKDKDQADTRRFLEKAGVQGTVIGEGILDDTSVVNVVPEVFVCDATGMVLAPTAVPDELPTLAPTSADRLQRINDLLKEVIQKGKRE